MIVRALERFSQVSQSCHILRASSIERGEEVELEEEGIACESLLDDDAQGKRKNSPYRLSVLIARPFSFPFDYLCDENLPDGTIVRVPLGKSEVLGCVWDGYRHTLPHGLRLEEPPRKIDNKRLRFIICKREDIRVLPASLRHFIDWVGAYTLAPAGLVLAIALRVPAKSSLKVQLGWVKNEVISPTLRMTPTRQAVLACASYDEPKIIADLAQESDVSVGVIRALIEARALIEKEITTHTPSTIVISEHRPILSEEQKKAASLLCASVDEQKFKVFLLEGVTGSGKTEVYFEAISSCLALGKQCLILLPEIALTAQWRERFKARFGVLPVIWHSDLSQKERRESWEMIAKGSAPIVVGARSALFLPFCALGLIIVDEEHESSFKQEEGVHYHGRDMAVLRARLENIPIILVSATPSLETSVNAAQGRYHHIQLHHRYGGARLPSIEIINMREQPPGRNKFLSPSLIEEIAKNIEQGEQSLLFLNRRGYAPLTLCRQCGYRFQCPNCTAWLVQHRSRNIFACHHCEYSEPCKNKCPECQEEESFMPIGPGVERIYEEVKASFSDAHILVMTTDTMLKTTEIEQAVEKIERGEVQIIIGTQMVAKGWHFPKLTLVGVVDADLGLSGGDLRASERTMQLLHQVAGRAGREEKKGRVMLQTYSAEHPVMKALYKQDIEAFLKQEAEMRKPGFWPPYGRLAAIIVSGMKEQSVDDFVRELSMSSPYREGLQILGPTPAPLAFLRGRYRRRFLLKSHKNIALQPIIRRWLAAHKLRDGVEVRIDIDPISFM